jgi:hypothetical protein
MGEQYIIPDDDNNSLCLGIDDYEDFTISPAAKNILGNILKSSRAGLISSSPLICSGPGNCPFVSRCPIYMTAGSEGLYPLRKQCIVESTFVQDRFLSYIDELSEEGVMDSITYRSQVSKLVEFDLYDYRLNLILAGVAGKSDGSLLIDQVTDIKEESGIEIHELAAHPAWEMKERLQNQRLRLLDAMGLTVKQKARIDVLLKRNTEKNILSSSIEVLEKLSALASAVTADEI